MNTPMTGEAGTITPPPALSQPALVLVQQGMVVGHFTIAQSTEADRAAVRLERICACRVAVYMVGRRLADIPRAGSHVDPAALGWLRLS